jgi:hypothetical protein
MRRVLGLLLVAATVFAAEPTPTPDAAPEPTPTPDPAPEPTLTPDPWTSLLLDRVTQSREVVYAAFTAEDRARLDRVLAELAKQDAGPLDRDHAVAFWLNAYHATVIAAVLHGESPATITGRARLYHWFHLTLAGYRLALDDVRFILNGFASKDPRIHLAIYDATRSGPKLAREPYRAEELDRQLVEATRRFVNDSRNFQVKPDVGRVALSRIFEWHRADFEREAGTLARFLQLYAQDSGLVAALESPFVGFESLPYDWRLAGSE